MVELEAARLTPKKEKKKHSSVSSSAASAWYAILYTRLQAHAQLHRADGFSLVFTGHAAERAFDGDSLRGQALQD